MKYIVIRALFLSALVALSTSVMADGITLDEIELNNVDFDIQVKKKAKRKVRADISFKKKRKFFKMLDDGDFNGINVEGLKHQYGDHGGGYVLGQGESLHEAGRIYQEDIKQMAKHLVKDMREQIVDLKKSNRREKDSELRAINLAVMRDLRAQIEEQNAIIKSIRQNGIEVFGVDINGMGEDVENFKRKSADNIYVAKIKDLEDTTVEQAVPFEK